MSKHDHPTFDPAAGPASSVLTGSAAPTPVPDSAALDRIEAESAQREVTGGCLCGTVRFAAKLCGHGYSACHCAECRAWAGGPVLSVRTSWFVLTAGEDKVGFHRASETLERSFCTCCGGHLSYRLVSQSGLRDNSLAMLGALDDCETLPLNAELHADARLSSLGPLGAPTQIDTATMTARRDMKLKTMTA